MNAQSLLHFRPEWCYVVPRTDRSRSSSSRSYIACRYEMLCTICMLYRSNPGKPAPDNADCTASTRQHELDHTDHTDQGSIIPERSRSLGRNRSYRSSVRGVHHFPPQWCYVVPRTDRSRSSSPRS